MRHPGKDLAVCIKEIDGQSMGVFSEKCSKWVDLKCNSNHNEEILTITFTLSACLDIFRGRMRPRSTPPEGCHVYCGWGMERLICCLPLPLKLMNQYLYMYISIRHARDWCSWFCIRLPRVESFVVPKMTFAHIVIQDPLQL